LPPSGLGGSFTAYQQIPQFLSLLQAVCVLAEGGYIYPAAIQQRGAPCFDFYSPRHQIMYSSRQKTRLTVI